MRPLARECGQRAHEGGGGAAVQSQAPRWGGSSLFSAAPAAVGHSAIRVCPAGHAPSCYSWPQPVLCNDRSLPNSEASTRGAAPWWTKRGRAESRARSPVPAGADGVPRRLHRQRGRGVAGQQVGAPAQLDRQFSGHRHDRSFAPDAGSQGGEAFLEFGVAPLADGAPGTLQQQGTQKARAALQRVPPIIQLARTVLARRRPK